MINCLIIGFCAVNRDGWTKQRIYSELADRNIVGYRAVFTTAETLQFISRVGICPNTLDKSML